MSSWFPRGDITGAEMVPSADTSDGIGGTLTHIEGYIDTPLYVSAAVVNSV